MTKGSSPDILSTGSLPWARRAYAVLEWPKRTTSTGRGALVPRHGTSLLSSTMMTSLTVAAATIFSLRRAPPSPLMRFMSPSTSSAPSIVTSMWSTSAMSTTLRPFSAARD